MKYRVLIQACPIWKPGERDVDAEPRRVRRENAPASERYPDDYAGRVVSVIPADKQFHPADVADPSRLVITRELTDYERDGLRSRMLKISLDRRIEDVTFDDRWGAVAEVLRANIEDPEAAEALDSDDDIEARRFDEISTMARNSLQDVTVHTGAGLYEVGPTKTYATIQSAFDQLWIDQGSALFTSSQVIRIFADTYDEAVSPNPSLQPDITNGYIIFAEGDISDDRNNIVLQPTSDTTILRAWDNTHIRHLALASAVCVTGIENSTSNKGTVISDCSITMSAGGSANTVGIRFRSGGIAEDCDITVTGTGTTSYGINTQDVSAKIARCLIVGPGTAKSGVQAPRGVEMESCAISGFLFGLGSSANIRIGRVVVKNSVIYNCGVCLPVTDWYAPSYEFTNVIVQSVTTVVEVYNSWPEINPITSQTGPWISFKHCMFYNYTNFGRQALPPNDTKTYAEFVAFNRVLAVDNVDGTDPEMTDPANGDFSLADGSPAIKAGHGSGVSTDYLGVAFDIATPDIGSWSSGVIPPPGPPSIPDPPAISAIVNDGDGDGATVTLETESGSDVYLYARIRNSIDAWALKGSRTDSGDIASTGHTNNSNYEFIAIATFGAAVNEDPSLPSIPATAFITDAAGFYSAIMQALYDWVDGELGIPVIWHHPNAPQPAKEYVTIDMRPTQGPQWDYKSPPDDVNGISTLRGDREFIVSLQLQGKKLPYNENAGLTLAEQLATSLQKESTIAAFNAAGFAFVDRVATTDLSALGGTEFESRASLELMFRMGHETTDTVGVIETVDTVVGTYE
jgi:hypothetical protein